MVLLSIFRTVYRAVLRVKKEHEQVKLGVSEQEVNKTIQFKPESNVKYQAVRAPVRKDILAEAADWELQFDMTAPEYNQTKERRFPVEILGGDPALRPDDVIWSTSIKTVVWIELTSAWEDNMSLWHSEKHMCYTQLKIDCEANGWKVHALCVEVGCQGYVSQ